MRAAAARLGRDGIAGAFVVALGAILYLLVRNYPRGTLSEFGPGMVPWAASIALVVLGAAMVVRALARKNSDTVPAMSRAILVVPAGMAFFALALEPLGLFATAAIGVFVTTLAARESSLIERLAVALGLATFATIVFGYGLAMTMPLWPFFLRP